MSIVLALPSKGRLKEQTLEKFAACGLPVELPAEQRSYRGRLSGIEGIELGFMSAAEIGRELAAGNLHLGVTGEDVAREATADADSRLEFLLPLGFGYADVVVAVPESWHDVATMADLDDVAAEFRLRHGRQLRIATKYWQLTRDFFADHGIAVYRIVESLGATEGAPAAGAADIIVDITTTGSTLRANHLKVLADGVILRSQANLVRSRVAKLPAGAEKTVARLVGRLSGGK
jgi:ATP phosphoribosyltransferase